MTTKAIGPHGLSLFVAQTLGATNLTSPAVRNFFWRSALIIAQFTGFTGGNYTLAVRDQTMSNNVAILTSAAIAANQIVRLVLDPGVTVVANLSASTLLPSKFDIRVTSSGAGAAAVLDLGVVLYA